MENRRESEIEVNLLRLGVCVDPFFKQTVQLSSQTWSFL